MDREGIVLVDKPAHITSRRAVDYIMEMLKVKRAGHFGSLDPFATGLLCIGVGQGTKLLPFMYAQEKEYCARIGLEMSTDTDDITGAPLKRFDTVHVNVEEARRWFSRNTGWINQVPPEYCAQKYRGKPLYKLKRANKDVSPRPKQVYIESAEILDSGDDWIKVKIVCSRGTYIRAIARDLGQALGYGGYLRELRRTRSEGFHVDDAYTIEEISHRIQEGLAVVIPLTDAVHLPKARVTRTGETGIREGHPIQVSWILDDVDAPHGAYVALMNGDRHLLCIARVERDGGIFGYIERGFRPY